MSPVIKKKPEKEKLPSKYVLMIMSFVCVILMALTFSNKISEKLVNNIAGTAMVPFQKGIASISGYLTDKSDEKKTIKALQKENKELQHKIDELTNENTLLLQDKYELNSLRELYELNNEYSQYDSVGARIIAWNSDSWYDSFIIDKGSNNGIMVDMNVIAGSGLVGRVSEVGSNWARVITIIDDTSYISATVLHTQDNLIVQGDLSLNSQGFVGYTRLSDTANKVEKGDKVVTSNISDKYLPGILIGYITTVEVDSNNLTKSGYITPVVDYSKLSKVLVIKQLKENYDY